MKIELNTGLTIYVSTYNFVKINLETVSKEMADGIVCIQTAPAQSNWVEVGSPEFYMKDQITNWDEL